jgi:hypothetical protein
VVEPQAVMPLAILLVVVVVVVFASLPERSVFSVVLEGLISACGREAGLFESSLTVVEAD